MPCFVWGTSWWWVIPLVMLAMMAIAMIAMRACSRRVRAMGGGMGGCCGPARSRGESALDALRRRYASGELTREEFEAMKTQVTA